MLLQDGRICSPIQKLRMTMQLHLMLFADPHADTGVCVLM